MAVGGGGSGVSANADDPSVLSTEKIWRLIDHSWYQGGALLEIAFKQSSLSALREQIVSESIVDAAMGGKFAKSGIAELLANSVRTCGTATGDATSDCVIKIEDNDPPWPAPGHVIIGKAPGGQTLKPRHLRALTKVANSQSLRRLPKP